MNQKWNSGKDNAYYIDLCYRPMYNHMYCDGNGSRRILLLPRIASPTVVSVYTNAQNTHSESLINFKTGIHKANTYNTLNKEGCDPNGNYGIIQDVISNKIKTYIPVRL